MNFIRKYSLMMLLLTGAMTIVSCSDDAEEFSTNNDGAITFVANMPGVEADTRTALTEDEQPLWTGREAFRLYSNISTDQGFLLQTTNLRKSRTAQFKMVGESQKQFENMVHKMNFVMGFHGAPIAHMSDKGVNFSFGSGSSDRLKQQVIPYKNISSNEDILISETMDPATISVSNDNPMRFKRLNGFMKIKLVDNTEGKIFTDYKVKTGWLTTGSQVPSKVEDVPSSGIYVDNNFAGGATVSLEEGSKYQLTKDEHKGSGIQLKSNGKYFYDFGVENDFFYVSVLPTKLQGGEEFSIGLGDGTHTKYIRKTITVPESGFEIKGCHIHEITIVINDSDVRYYN